MKTRSEIALDKRKQGYNCAQAIACTFCDLAGVDEKTLFKMTEALGLGMGGMEGTCGAVTAACVLAGLKQSSGNTEAPDSMKDSLRLSKEIVSQFLAKNGTIVCKELKGVATGTVIRSCPDCITDTVEILEKVLYAEC